MPRYTFRPSNLSEQPAQSRLMGQLTVAAEQRGFVAPLPSANTMADYLATLERRHQQLVRDNRPTQAKQVMRAIERARRVVALVVDVTTVEC